MKARRLLILVLALSVLGAGAAAAGTDWGKYKGFPQVKVHVNGAELSLDSIPAFITDGSVVLPMRKFAESLQAIVNWDSSANVANIYKPNVHMLVAREISKDWGAKQIFGKVQRGDNLKFVVLTQVDNLETDIYSFKIEIADPYGNVVAVSDEAMLREQRDSFWYTWPFEVRFEEYGEYKVKFLMKPRADSGFVTVSEKAIASR